MSFNKFDKVFADAQVGVDGLLYKAGFSELTDTEEGLGRGFDGNEWVTTNGATIVNGGIRATSSGQIDINMPDAAGRFSAIRQAFMSRSAIQIKMHIADLAATVGTLDIFRSYSVSGGAGSPIYLRCQIPTQTINSLPALVASDYDGNLVFDNYSEGLTGSAVIGNVEGVNPVFHSGLADSDGYVLLGIDNAGAWQRWFINGYPIAEMPTETYDGEFNNFALQRGVSQVSMKELLVYDRPFTRSRPVDLRVSFIGHSYNTRQQLKRKSFDNGVIGGLTSGSFPQCSYDAFNTSLMRNIKKECVILSTGYSSQNIAYQESRIINGTPTPFSIGSGNDQDQVKRHRPHFCIVLGSVINDAGTSESSLKTSLYNIITDLMGNGIIPVIAIEWDNIDLTAITSQGYAEEESDRNQAVNDIGIIKGSIKFGSDPDHSLSAYESATGRHPNFKGQNLWGEYIADEINRLLLSPPNYSRLAGGNGEYVAIAAP